MIKATDMNRMGFLWKDANEARAIACMVSWKMVHTSKGLGDLGVLNLRHFDISLLLKRMWKLLANRNTPWASLILHSYRAGAI